MNDIYYDTWVINVKKNHLKRNFISDQFKFININYNFFNAITPSSKTFINHSYNKRRTEIHYGRPLMNTELACALSHISLWENLINQNKFTHYLILEDDVEIDTGLDDLLNSYDFSKLDLIKLSGQHNRPNKQIAKLIHNRNLYMLAYGPLDASAYLISKKAAKQMLPYALKLNFAIDVIMDRSFEHKIPIYCIKPYPVISKWHNDPNDPLFSDIGLRTYKYSKNRHFLDKFKTRWIRIKTSYYRRLSRFKLILGL